MLGAGPRISTVSRVRGHVRISAALFGGLGFQVGVWAVLVPELVASRDLGPGGLGLALGVLAASSILALAAGGRVVDRIGRRPLAVAGSGGIGMALVVLAAPARSARRGGAAHRRRARGDHRP
jgi:MFS family permease